MVETTKRPRYILAERPAPRSPLPPPPSLSVLSPDDVLLLRLLLAATESDGFATALHGILREVCQTTGWTVGEAWVPLDLPERLHLAATFHPAEKRFAEFCEASRSLPPSQGTGMLSQGFPGAEPAWDADLVARSEFLRATAANDAGLRSGVAFPLRAGLDPVALLEFFAAESRPADADFVRRLKEILPRVAPALRIRRSEEALREMAQRLDERLRERTQEIGRRGEAVALLNGMTGMLQSAKGVGDILEILRQVCPRLFPATRGGLYAFDASRRTLEAVVSWESLSAAKFHVDDCWGLRLSQAHVVRFPGGGPVCGHLEGTPEGKALCFPLFAHGEAHGLLHLSGSDADERFALNVASQIALAMANVKLRDSLEAQAMRDPLTGLFNRRHLTLALEREIRRAEREKTTVSVIMADIDFFKKVNDTFGHAAGDEVLRELGTFFTRFLRPYDVACRYGGEEFTLILPGSTLENAVRHAERLRQAARELAPVFEGRPLGSLTLSLGVAAWPEDGETVEDVIAASDAALYRAKAGGRNRVVASDPFSSR